MAWLLDQFLHGLVLYFSVGKSQKAVELLLLLAWKVCLDLLLALGFCCQSALCAGFLMTESSTHAG